MKKVIKEGNIKPKIFTCSRCGSIFESDEYRVDSCSGPYIGGNYIENCPKCHTLCTTKE